ncbi:MAG: glycosyltransferase [Rubrivivax sp.]|nr:glycosyltransferase [Rubrivivax sp.]MDH5339486.1 glycosyltransferase [Rubrivivax sp.]
MKILHVLLSRGFAGSERSTAESCNAQCVRHELVLAVRDDHRKGGASVVDHVDPRVRVVALPRLLLTQWKLARLVRDFGPDVIHCHLRRSTRLVSRIETAAVKVSTLHIGFNGRHFHGMDGLVCNARWQIAQLPPEFKGVAHKANNSLLPQRRLPADAVAALRAGLGAQPGDFVVGGVGRLAHVKGWDTLIDAVRALPQLAQVKVFIFGQGSDEAALKARTGGDPRIALPGFRPDVKDLYQAFDVFVCPSRFEPLPRVMLEALDAGTPVIASDADGCRELIEDYGGDLFPIGDAAALAALLADHVARPRGRREVDLAAHHVDAANAAMEAFYQRLLARRRAPLPGRPGGR